MCISKYVKKYWKQLHCTWKMDKCAKWSEVNTLHLNWYNVHTSRPYRSCAYKVILCVYNTANTKAAIQNKKQKTLLYKEIQLKHGKQIKLNCKNVQIIHRKIRKQNKQQKRKTKQNKSDRRTTISIITLNVDALNTRKKKQN